MKSAIIRIQRDNGEIIPFTYNYYIAISFYNKLIYYQSAFKELHKPEQIGIHTFSNIISRNFRVEKQGLNIPKGIIVFRSIDDAVVDYFRLGVSNDPILDVTGTLYSIKSIENPQRKDPIGTRVRFKTISPTLIRNFDSRKQYIDREELVDDNLTKEMKWVSSAHFNFNEPVIKISITKRTPKSVRVSGSNNNESITTAWNLEGEMEGDRELIKLFYYKGLGSKTGLGLGCWELA